MVLSEPFVAPTDWFVYGHLHFILALPTLTLLYLSPPLQSAQPLQKQASYAFVGFIAEVVVFFRFIALVCFIALVSFIPEHGRATGA